MSEDVYEQARQEFTEEEVELLTAAVAAINCLAGGVPLQRSCERITLPVPHGVRVGLLRCRPHPEDDSGLVCQGRSSFWDA